MYKKYQLKNKANVVLVPLADTKSVTVLIMYPVGSRYEPEKLAGVSHYIEHLMFKGTKKRPNTLVLTREIDRLGASYNAFTSKEYTGYYIKTDAKYTETAVDILSDMLFNSKFDAKEMEREKGPIVEEIRMYQDNPLMNIDNVFEDLLYDGCPLGRDIAGSEKHVLSYKRNEVLAFKNKYYQPQNMTIVVSGNVDENTKKIIEQYFGSEKNKGKINKNFKEYKFGSKKIDIQNKKTDQVQLMLGFPGLKHNDKSSPVSAVMNTIFGGSMSSRLFIEIRERRGLAYLVRSGGDNFRDTGYQSVRIGLESKNINKAIAVVKTEMEKLIKKGPTARELKDAKTHIRGGLTLSFEDSSNQASYYANQALFADKIKTPEERLREIDKVTKKQIQMLAKKLFNWKKIRVAIIGDVDKKTLKF
jgi:predicted Zn-dependent peptidase